MTTINIVAIKRNGQTITTQALDQRSGAQEVLRWMREEGFYGRIIKVFFGSDEYGLAEYTPTEIQELAQ